MKLVACLVLFLFFSNSFSQSVSPQFSELKGMEDQSANTHLFYRIYTYFANDPIYETHNDIYHLDLETFIDSIFLGDYSLSDPVISYFRAIKDYAFWNKDCTKFIFGGAAGSWEPIPYIQRFDEANIQLDFFQGEVNQIDISNFDDSLLFAGGWLIDLSNGELKTIKSTDGGFNWNVVSDTLHFLSMNPYNENVLFAVNEDDELYKSSDSGNSFYIVDTVANYNWGEFFYDKDQHHIYRKTFVYPYNSLIVSSNNGEPFSWEIKDQYDSQIHISLDDSISGTIFLANEKNIYLSTNYGDNFYLYKSLDRNIVGIYKKPNSNKLYAATKYKIYEITPDTIQVIKSLPIPDEVLNYYPLEVGNKWVYDENTIYYDTIPHGSSDILIKEIIGDTIAPNGKNYYVMFDETLWGINYVLERVDSSEGKVYRYYEDPTLSENEYLVDDLLAEVGDTIYSSRLGFGAVMYTTVLAEETFEKWGLTKPKKVFEQYTLHPPVYSLTQDIGLDSIHSYFDFGDTWIILKGCIIDGVVYGDTTVVSVEDEEPILPFEFELSQNYPNPFNPTTIIKFTIPQDGRRETRNVTLKIYDVLANEVATLINEEKPAESYEVVFNAAKLPSGVYFYQLRAGSFIETKKMVLLK